MTSIRDLEQRLLRLEAELARRPLIVPVSLADPIYRLRVDRGNTLASIGGIDFYGVKQRISPAITSVPAATPTIGGSYADGLTAAYLLTQELEVTTLNVVWILHGPYVDAAGTSGGTEAIGPLPQGYVALSRKRVSMNVASGGTTAVYVPWR